MATIGARCPRRCLSHTKQLEQRKKWVNRFLHKGPTWWTQNIHLTFDGVTLTKAPKSLDLRQKHAAQSIRHMGMKKTEKMDHTLFTHNTHGVQLGTKGASLGWHDRG